MAGLPDITIVGTLTADPELRYTPNGVGVANFTIAANDRRFNAQTGEWVDDGATFLRCTVWRQLAEHVAESLRKGNRVIALGQLRQRSYEVDGQKRTAYDVDVTEVGPSLKFAYTKVAKAARSTGTRDTTPEDDDPWTAAPERAPVVDVDELPF